MSEWRYVVALGISLIKFSVELLQSWNKVEVLGQLLAVIEESNILINTMKHYFASKFNSFSKHYHTNMGLGTNPLINIQEWF